MSARTIAPTEALEMLPCVVFSSVAGSVEVSDQRVEHVLPGTHRGRTPQYGRLAAREQARPEGAEEGFQSQWGDRPPDRFLGHASP